ncbi:hypothetical protein B484DRAFT_429435, partial [Ochromonadaceae sp. CCMP2298]
SGGGDGDSGGGDDDRAMKADDDDDWLNTDEKKCPEIFVRDKRPEILFIFCNFSHNKKDEKVQKIEGERFEPGKKCTPGSCVGKHNLTGRSEVLLEIGADLVRFGPVGGGRASAAEKVDLERAVVGGGGRPGGRMGSFSAGPPPAPSGSLWPPTA